GPAPSNHFAYNFTHRHTRYNIPSKFKPTLSINYPYTLDLHTRRCGYKALKLMQRCNEMRLL
ncbi:MAG: hypothetical protein QXP58_01780, partial [Thermoprotei archaeon]